jgi:replicative DNA helicase
MKDKIEIQEKIINLLINDHNLVNTFVANKLEPENFDPKYRPVLYAVHNAHTQSVRLTENGFVDFVERTVVDGSYAKWTEKKVDGPKQPIMAERALFLNVSKFIRATKDDFELYLKQFKEISSREKANQLFEKYQTNVKNGTFFDAVSGLAEGLTGLSNQNSTSKAQMIFVDKSSQAFMQSLKDKRENPVELLLTGIPELDESISVGLTPGSLTLFVADVGGYKSTMMLNVGLNVFKRSKKSVLFVSLEMPEHMVKCKIISRETGVHFDKIVNPQKLSDAEMQRIEDEWAKWNFEHKFVILDASDDRLSVADIKFEIEKNIAFFKPDVVIVDYITILAPEKWYIKQQSHEWVGHMCKGLRQLGRKHKFAVISAAQLGRDAIKRLKTQKEGQQTVGSEDLRGSHEFSADSDGIYVLVPHPNQPNQKIQLFCAKSRYGKKTFNGSTRAILDVNADIGRITGSIDATWGHDESSNDIAVKHGESVDSKMNFDDNLDLDNFEDAPSAPKPMIKIEPLKEAKKPAEKKSNGRVALDLD